MSRVIVILLAVALAPAIFAEKWVQQYFYDENEKELRITDLAFSSATRGVAVGAILNNEGKSREYLALVTIDGGEHWAKVPLKEFPRSLFFLPESSPDHLGWMVTEHGIWLTEEDGRSWRKVSDQIGEAKKLLGGPGGGVIDRVWFLDAQHGFAIGGRKSAFESKDGGRTWVPVVSMNAQTPSIEKNEKPAKLTSEQKSEQEARLAYSAYTAMAFIGNDGIIAGGLVPPQRTGYSDVPGWLEPETVMKRPPSRTLAFEMDTHDGGANWRESTAPTYGAITQIHLAADWGLAVWNFDDASEFASEAQRINARTGKGETVFRRSDRRVTDSQLYPDGSAFLAAVEPVGTMRSAPIPGKVRILHAGNVASLRAAPDKQDKKAFLDDWAEMQVDYRAVANLVYLAGPDADHMWAATDTGMILKLVK